MVSGTVTATGTGTGGTRCRCEVSSSSGAAQLAARSLIPSPMSEVHVEHMNCLKARYHHRVKKGSAAPLKAQLLSYELPHSNEESLLSSEPTALLSSEPTVADKLAPWPEATAPASDAVACCSTPNSSSAMQQPVAGVTTAADSHMQCTPCGSASGEEVDWGEAWPLGSLTRPTGAAATQQVAQLVAARKLREELLARRPQREVRSAVGEKSGACVNKESGGHLCMSIVGHPDATAEFVVDVNFYSTWAAGHFCRCAPSDFAV